MTYKTNDNDDEITLTAIVSVNVSRSEGRISLDQALEILEERIYRDEDGFDYQIDFNKEKDNGIHLDAESVKREMKMNLDNYSEAEIKAVLKADDEEIERLINSEVDSDFWSEYDDICHRVTERLIKGAKKDNQGA